MSWAYLPLKSAVPGGGDQDDQNKDDQLGDNSKDTEKGPATGVATAGLAIVMLAASGAGVLISKKRNNHEKGVKSAAEESVFLTKVFAKHVTVLVRKDDFSCAASVSEKDKKNHEKITSCYKCRC